MTLVALWSGPSVAAGGAGDVDQDGLSDPIVRGPWADSGRHASAGRTYVVFGDPHAGEISLADVAERIGGFVLDGAAGHT